jgi:hypothetical protein
VILNAYLVCSHFSSRSHGIHNPPQVARHPLHLLKTTLILESNRANQLVLLLLLVQRATPDQKATEEEVLRVADFLYGSTLMEPWGYWIRLNPLPKSYRYPSQRSLHLVQIDNSTFVSCLPTTPIFGILLLLSIFLEKVATVILVRHGAVCLQALAPSSSCQPCM